MDALFALLNEVPVEGSSGSRQGDGDDWKLVKDAETTP